ncbi:hypothetical protein VNO78_32348 [Psophocarpus tetragonolobus]|uniref:Uncharacterized protein n=1 Tax=Psophocarpus tetragonolobus TaxID=3891 RepID=A0AAN9RP29_PSOTE
MNKTRFEKMHNGGLGRNHHKENHLNTNEVSVRNAQRNGMEPAYIDEPTLYANAIKNPFGFFSNKSAHAGRSHKLMAYNFSFKLEVVEEANNHLGHALAQKTVSAMLEVKNLRT